MGPEELDDLLASIRAEGNKERSALALYKGTRGTDLVNESIDERVVNILGLGQVFDIDYATYLTLLKEKLVQVSMGGGSLAREEQMLLQDEFKRVKGKVGRFKINRRTANVGAISGSTPLKVSKDKFFLTSSAVIPENPGVAKVSEDLKGIHEALDKLLGEIKADNAEEKKQAELERRQKIRNRRVAREKLLEKSQQKVSRVVNKLFTPVRGILDSIFRFLFFGLLGRSFQSFLNWFSDPANKDKVDNMFRFLKDFWPAILGGLALFFTPLGGFVKGIVKLLTFFGPKLFRLVAKYPKIALATAGAAALLKAATSQSPNPERAEQGKTELDDTQEFGGMTGAPISGDMLGFNQGGLIPVGSDKLYNVSNYFGRPIERASGKITSTTGTKIKGTGPDTQLIAAQPGEFIISKNAVNTYGSQFFMNLNKEGGGTNIPNFVNNIQFAQGGGMVGGMIGSPTSFITAPTGGGGGTNALTEQAKTKTLGTYIGDGIQEFLGVTPKRMRSSLPSTDENIRDTVGGAIETYEFGSGGLMGSSTSQQTSGEISGSPTLKQTSGGLMGLPTSVMGVGGLTGSQTNDRFGDKLPMSPEPSRKMTLPLKSLMMISDEKSSESSLDTQMSSGVSMNTTAATVRYTDNMMSPTQRITLPPEPPVRSKKPNMTVLPEIVRNSAPQMQASASSSSVPSFSPSQSNDTRQLNFAVYGIEGMN